MLFTNNLEPLEQGIDGLTGEMSEILVLSPVSRIHPSLSLSISNMSFFHHGPDSTSQALRMHPIELGLTQSTKQVVDYLIVGVEHVPRSWSEEVHQLDIACVHRGIPKDLTLSVEERRFHTCFSKENQVLTYMHAKIKFHAYSDI
jgi:hypothetical protein